MLYCEGNLAVRCGASRPTLGGLRFTGGLAAWEGNKTELKRWFVLVLSAKASLLTCVAAWDALLKDEPRDTWSLQHFVSSKEDGWVGQEAPKRGATERLVFLFLTHPPGIQETIFQSMKRTITAPYMQFCSCYTCF